MITGGLTHRYRASFPICGTVRWFTTPWFTVSPYTVGVRGHAPSQRIENCALMLSGHIRRC